MDLLHALYTFLLKFIRISGALANLFKNNKLQINYIKQQCAILRFSTRFNIGWPIVGVLDGGGSS